MNLLPALSSSRLRRALRQTRIVAAAIVVTLVAAQANAGIVIPNAPLQANGGVPANVWFILDDSGSMAATNLPDNVPATAPVNISAQAYTRNTIHYNPEITYRPWRQWNGTFMPDATYLSASNDPINLSSPTNLGTVIRTFYAPVTGITDLSDARQYVRYQILVGGLTATACGWTNLPAGFNNCAVVSSFTWASGTRTLDQEKANYANWYQYHRTRTKVAKAGASDAFNQIGTDIRVGFTTIWDRNTFLIPVGVDGGLFDNIGPNTNRSTWFDRLFNATANGTTPLKASLNRAGQYFSRTDGGGPYGPEALESQQIPCRQNFSILVTDGYANENAFPTANEDGTAGPTITGPGGQSFTYTPALPYSDNTTGTLADIAMRYWKNDLRTGLVNNVPSSPADPAFWQHMVTFGISIGAEGNLDPQTDLPNIMSGAKVWPTTTPANLTPATIDDFWHATINGRGDFVVASNPDEFSRSLKNALAAILSRTRSNANVAVTSTRVTGSTAVFEPSYNTGLWSGDITAYGVTSAGVSATPLWRASNGIPNHVTRRIFTSNGASGSTFSWAGLSPAQQLQFGSVDVFNYVRGDDSRELRNGGTFRDRSTKLGDIVNSSPVYEKDTNTLYAGANDGMLHAFDAATGQERFAYVPSGIDYTELATLADRNYAHKYFVDGELAVSTTTQTPGKRVLIGLLGRGGKAGRPAVYALDVTNPTTFGASDVMWEYSDPGLVNALGRPIIVKLNNGQTGVVIGNGYNSNNDRAILYVLNIDTGALISKIDTGVGSTLQPNGLAAPRGWDMDRDGAVDQVYAGDLRGNLWRFTLTGPASQWSTPANRGVVYTALDGGGNPQPITGGVSIGLHPTTFKRWIFFGTGRYLTAADPSSRSVQSWYGVIDDGTTIPGRSDLKRRTIQTQALVSGRTVRTFEAAVLGDMAGKRGWFVDLLTPPYPPGTAEGERMVSDSILFGNVLLASSIIPTSSICDADVKGFVNVIDPFSGGSVLSPYFDVNNDGRVDANDVVATPGGPLPGGSIDLGGGFTTNPVVIENVLVAGGLVRAVNVANPSYAGRISWRELIRN